MTDLIVSCRGCSAPPSELTRFANFKHFWFMCRRCGTMSRKEKSSYPADWLARMLSGPGIRGKIGNRLVPAFMRRADAEERGYADYGAFFDWVIDPHTNASGLMRVKREAYFREPDQVLDTFSRCGITLADKSILDVSGGPGTFAHLIRGRVGNITVSEYSARTVGHMQERLGDIRTFQADLNKPWADQESFDVVLYRSCIVFCLDFGRHLSEMRSRILDGGYIYVYSAKPSLGNALRWQYEDYTNNVFYSVDAVRRALGDNGFEIVETGTTEEYRHYLRWFGRKEALFHLWGVWNRLTPRGPRGFDATAFWLLARKSGIRRIPDPPDETAHH